MQRSWHIDSEVHPTCKYAIEVDHFIVVDLPVFLTNKRPLVYNNSSQYICLGVNRVLACVDLTWPLDFYYFLGPVKWSVRGQCHPTPPHLWSDVYGWYFHKHRFTGEFFMHRKVLLAHVCVNFFVARQPSDINPSPATHGPTSQCIALLYWE